MRLPSVFSGPFRWLTPLLCMIACCGVAPAQTTVISGTVYSPLGPATGDPIPNILVFAVNPAYPPPAFTQGVVDGGCANQPSLVPAYTLGNATTDAAGKFSFVITGTVPSPLNIVIQAGKWRRQYINTRIVTGSSNTPLALSMPASSGTLSDGSIADLPHIAVVTGSADDVECIFKQIGISTSEFTLPSGTGSINLYEGDESGGQASPDSTSTNPTPVETLLESSVTKLEAYDLVMFGCQGTPTDPEVSNATQGALINYANTGGRVFATHYGYVWLYNDQPFESAATWSPGAGAPGTAVATIDQTYPEGAILAQWLQNIGATTTIGQITLNNTKVDTKGVNNPPAQSWLTLNSFTGNPSMQFTFNTPIGAAGTPTVGVSYTNTQSSFFQGDTADSVVINVTNSSSAAADASLTLTLGVPGGLSPTSLGGSSGTGWNCSLGSLTCTRTTALAAGASDPVTLVFNIASTTAVGSVSLTASLNGGGLSGSSQCGRVLFNDYHVEAGATRGHLYPADCSNGTVTPQEKFLEFSLYNISNFVAPSTSDLITIQGPVTIVWPQPAAISYGTALSNTQLDATAVDNESNTSIPGTFVYTPPVGSVLQANTPCPNLSVTFTPTDNVDYASATATKCLEVDPAGTTTTLVTARGSTTPGAVTPIYYGQIIGDTAVMAVTSNNPGVGIDGGNMLFYINGQVQCNIPITVIECPATTGAGYDAGTYQVYSAYSGDSNFLASQSAVYSVTVLPDPTLTTLASSASISPPGQAITFTGNIADQYYSPVAGTVTFSDGTTVLGTVPVNASDVATYTTSSLNIGVHSIKACFVSAVDPSGTYDFVNSCSPAIPEAISLPSTIGTTSTTLTSSLNPSVVGQTVTFSATAATTGSFISTPTGTVTFYDGANQIGSGILNNGVATLAISTLAAGLHNITASYLGSSTMAPSTSAILVQQVNVGIGSAGQGFLMTVSPTTFSVGAGSSVSVAVTILDLNNFNLPVALGCSGLPTEATCTFSTPTIVAPGGTTPLTITVNAPHNCDSNTPYFVAGTGNTVLPILATVVFAFFARRRRILKGIALAAILCLLPAINGCGGNCTDLGVRPGTYTFTVTGTTSGAVPVTVAVPAGGASTIPGTSQSQTMIMTVTI
jgi:hypothetical protein